MILFLIQGRLPARWMAIESLQEAKYTSKSDMYVQYRVYCSYCNFVKKTLPHMLQYGS